MGDLLTWVMSWGLEALVVAIVLIALFIFGLVKQSPWWVLGPIHREMVEEMRFYRGKVFDSLGLAESAVKTAKALNEEKS